MNDKQKPWKPEPPFVIHRAAMRESEAWSVLDHNAKRFLERLELEHMKHGGKDNGKLPCTYNDLVRYGMRRETIARSIRRAVTCGFTEITRRGRRSAAGANPALYRLTYLPDFDGAWPTDEWKNYRPKRPLRQTPQAPEKRKLKAATLTPQIQNVGTGNGTDTVPKTVPTSVPKTVLPAAQTSVPKTVLLSKVYPSSQDCEAEGDAAWQRNSKTSDERLELEPAKLPVADAADGQGMAMAAMSEVTLPITGRILPRLKAKLMSSTCLSLS